MVIKIMWKYNDELYHYGVKGMRWGHRKVEPRSLSERYYSFRANRYKKHANAVQKDIDSFKGHEKGIKTNSGKVLLSAQDVKDSVNGLKSVRNKSLAKSKKYENKAESSRKVYNAKNESSKSKMSTAKKLAIGAGIAAAVVGTGVAVYTIKSGNGKRLANMVRKKINSAKWMHNSLVKGKAQRREQLLKQQNEYLNRHLNSVRQRNTLNINESKPIKLHTTRNITNNRKRMRLKGTGYYYNSEGKIVPGARRYTSAY